MVIWTPKSIFNRIKSFNMSNYDKFQKTINAHQNKIDCLKYNDNDDIENKEFIIFFQKKIIIELYGRLIMIMRFQV